MMWGGFEGMGWGWGMGIVHSLLWLVFVVLGIVVLVRLLGRGPGSAGAPPTSPAETALEILEKRYARGEIGKDEFLEKKRDLSGPP